MCLARVRRAEKSRHRNRNARAAEILELKKEDNRSNEQSACQIAAADKLVGSQLDQDPGCVHQHLSP